MIEVVVKNRSIFLILMLFMLAGCSPSTDDRKTNKETRKNVVIILTDDMGYGDISTYGQTKFTTPNIDGLANKGTTFTDFYVPVPYCAPSRASLLTGRFPLRHGLVQNPAPDTGIDGLGISANELMLGEVLQEAGYRTKLIGKWHLGHTTEYFPTKHGFDEYYGILYSNDMRPVQLIENIDTAEYPVDQSLLTKKYTEKAVEFLTRNREEPFFLHLCHAMPHKPLAASEDFYTPETPDDLYNDVIRELDWSVGKIVQTLEDLGILDNTIIIFMSDNGPSWGGNTGELKGMKATSWEGGTRVPFIIRGDGVPQNQIVNTAAWSPDVFPTLLEMLEIEIPENRVLDGESIVEVIKGTKTDHNPIYTLRQDRVMTIRDNDWKLFLDEPRYYNGITENYLKSWEARSPDGETIIAPAEQYYPPTSYPGIEPTEVFDFPLLFNIKNDPGETINLAKDNTKKVLAMQAQYEAFIKSMEVD